MGKIIEFKKVYKNENNNCLTEDEVELLNCFDELNDFNKGYVLGELMAMIKYNVHN